MLEDSQLTSEQKLHKRLFNSSYYSVDLLPRYNNSGKIKIEFGFELVKIVEVVRGEFPLFSFQREWTFCFEKKTWPQLPFSLSSIPGFKARSNAVNIVASNIQNW